MAKSKSTIIFFIAIVILGAALRLYNLGSVPASPDWDEAALGYNAYSILKTGRDEYGTKLPLSIRSFDDYKPPLYVYLTVPTVAVFGLSTWAVRLPSALFGILAVIGTFFLVKELLVKTNMYDSKTKSVPLVAMALLAISPWHLQFSRIAFEANIGVTFNIWAVYFFLRGLEKIRFLGISAFLFGLSLYAYHSERIFAPLLLVLLIITFFKQLQTYKTRLIIPVVIGFLTVLPIIFVFLNPTTLTRLRGTSSLSDQTGLLMRSVNKLNDDISNGDKLGFIFDNRRLVWVRTIMDGYLSHYSLRWLFISGDNPRHHAPDVGLLYVIELPFFLFGLTQVWKRGGKLRIILFGWLILAPVAASPTTELPHAIRTLVFLPSFQIIIAFGVIGFISVFQRRNLKRLAAVCVFCGFLFNSLYYFHMYYNHMDKEDSQYWQYGYRQTVDYIKTQEAKYDKIVVSTKLEQPHMFFLYFLAYDPVAYLKEGGTASGGFEEMKNRFGKYEFRPIQWDKEARDGRTLYVGTPRDIPRPNKIQISYLDGSPAFSISE